MATGFGLKPVRKLGGGELRVRPYVVAATEGSVLCVGEVVELDGGIDTKTQLPTIKIGTATTALLGSIVGFEADGTNPFNADFRSASTRRIVYVCDDPDAVFQVQEDAVGGSVSAANVAVSANADVVIAAGTSTTRVSGTMLDSSDAKTTSAQLKIVGVMRDDVNAAAQSGGAVLEVMIFEHALKTADSQS